MQVLGIDIGGSSLKGAPVDLVEGQLLAEEFRVETPGILSPAAMADAVAEIVRHFSWTHAVGCGFPGVVRGGNVTFTGNLHRDFVGLDIKDLFRTATGRQVDVINDADAAGLAEVNFGAGFGRDGLLLMLTFGTGVGSSMFLNGNLVPNSELGHLPMRGKSAELWMAASVKARLDLSYQEWATRLNEYLQLVEKLINPDLIIAGGAISSAHEEWLKYITVESEIVPAKLRNAAGIVGAALACKPQHFKSATHELASMRSFDSAPV